MREIDKAYKEIEDEVAKREKRGKRKKGAENETNKDQRNIFNSTEGSKSVANTTKETVKGQSGKISFGEESAPEKVESQDWIMKTASVLI